MDVDRHDDNCFLANLTPDKMRHTVVAKEKLSPVLNLLEISAPLIAQSAKPGQFVMVWTGEKSERIPLTVSAIDKRKGTVSIIFQEVGRGTIELGRFDVGDTIPSLSGPLGQPTEIAKFGTCVVIGGGVGTAIARPIALALKEVGNTLITIIGAREKSLVILEDNLRSFSDEVIITTDDGSYGRKGIVTEPLKEIMQQRQVDLVVAIGPLPMMKAVADTTREKAVKTIVSLDPIMVDGTGMCGGCRVTVGGETKFACVDGPDFDAHLVDWDELRARKAFYFEQERTAREDTLGGQD